MVPEGHTVLGHGRPAWASSQEDAQGSRQATQSVWQGEAESRTAATTAALTPLGAAVPQSLAIRPRSTVCATVREAITRRCLQLSGLS